MTLAAELMDLAASTGMTYAEYQALVEQGAQNFPDDQTPLLVAPQCEYDALVSVLEAREEY